MRALLICIAALSAAALPAAAQAERSPGFVAAPGSTGSHINFRGHRGRGAETVWVYDREYQGDTSWRSDSFNDWWHSRPDRAYPAWVQRNQDCQRVYWSGGGWRC